VNDQVRAPVIVLVHSSSVGPSTWAAVARELRSGGEGVQVPSMLGFADDGPASAGAYLDRATAALRSLPVDRPVLLVGHSNAGLFLPAIALSLAPRAIALVFADASIPPLDGPDVELAPAAFLDELRPIAVDGVLPRWGDWWPDAVTAGLYPDASTRRAVAAEEPQLPVSFYEERVDVPSGWARRPCGYLRLSDGYESEAVTATELGWPVRRLAGEHLHMLVDPPGVAGALRDLASTLIPPAGGQEA
jgi:Alpha/beta hydrolase family